MKNLFVLMLFLLFLFFYVCGFFHTCVGIPKQVIFFKAVLEVFLTPGIAWAPLKR